MRLTTYLFICLLFFAFPLSAQVFNHGYFNLYEDYAERIFEQSNGDFLLFGSGHNEVGNEAGWFRLRIDDHGYLREKDLYLQSGTTAFLEEVIRDQQDNYVMVTRNIGPIKVDSAGNVLWAFRCFGSSNVNWTDVALCPNGDYMLVGLGSVFGYVNLLRLGPGGNVIFHREYQYQGDWDSNAQIAALNDGSFSIAAFESDLLQPTMLRVDALGNVRWANAYDGFFNIVELIPGQDASTYLTGYGNQSGDYFAVLAQVDSTGAVVWSRRYNSQPGCRVGAMTRTSSGGFALAGWADTPAAHLIMVDSIGQLQWNKVNGPADSPRWISSIIQDSKGGFAFTGSGEVGFNTDYDAQAIRVDSLGNGLCTGDTLTMTMVASYALPDSQLAVTPVVVTVTCNPIVFNQVPSPLKDTLKCGEIVALEPSFTSEMRVWPQPAHDRIQFAAPANSGRIRVELWDLAGRRLYADEVTAGTVHTWSVRDLSPGIYLLRYQEAGMLRTQKVVVEH